MDIVLSERDKELILYQSYTFSYKELTKNGRKWRYTVKSSNAKL